MSRASLHFVNPHPGGLRDQLNPEPNNPTLNSGGLAKTAAGFATNAIIEEREDGVAAKESVRVIAGRLGLASDSKISPSGKSCSTT
jgi:hypothetical protein